MAYTTWTQPCGCTVIFTGMQEPDAFIEYCPMHAAAPLAQAACIAGAKYDNAIRECNNSPEKMASFCTFQGDTLDTLYMDWMAKITKALLVARPDQQE